MADVRYQDLPPVTTLAGTDLSTLAHDNGDSTFTTSKITLSNFVAGLVTLDLVSLADTQTLSNKTLGNSNTVTLKDSLFTLQNGSDVTKQLVFDLAGLTTATTRTLSVPDVSSTLAVLDAQTFTGLQNFDTGVVVSSASDSAALIAMNNDGNTGLNAILIEHDPTALDPNAANFYWSIRTFPGVNEPISPIADTVWYFGYNIDGISERVNSAYPALALHWESHFNRNPTTPGDPDTMEWHLQFNGLDDVRHRPISFLFDSSGGANHGLVDVSDLSLFDWSGDATTGQRIKFSFPIGAPTTVEFFKNSTLFFDASGTVPIVQKNAAGTTYLALPYYDSFDTMHLDNKVIIGNTITYGGVTLANAVTGTGSMVLSVGPTITGTLGAAAATFSSTVSISGALTYGGVTLANAVTGTGNMVLSASPTLTGTLTAADATLSGALTYGGVTLASSVTGTGSMVLSASPTLTGTLGAAAATFSSTVSIGAALTYGGVTLANAVTGTGSMVLSASPTLTGTLTAADATLSGALTYGGVTLASSVTGTGSMVLSASPTLTGTLGAAAATFSSTLSIGDALTYGGVTLANAVTGTGSMVLSASPTLTGTLTAADATLSGALTYGGVTLASSVTGTGSMVLSASPTLTGTLGAAAATFSSTVSIGAALTYGGVTLSGSVTGTGSMVLAASPTLTSPTLVTPALGVATATSLAISTASPDGTVTATAALLNPSLTETSATNTATIALRGLSVAPSIAAASTQNYTGGTGVVGVTIGPTITAGATGTLTAWNGETITLLNNSTSMAVTNAYGLTVNNFVTAGGVYSYTVGGYFKDQSNGGTGNIALLVGGAGVPSIAGNYSLYNQSTVRSLFVDSLTLVGTTAPAAGGSAGKGLMFSSTASFGVFFGSGAPTISAAQGSLYLRTDGSATNNRAYINTNGGTTWTALTTAA
jgi:hypothetical protein